MRGMNSAPEISDARAAQKPSIAHRARGVPFFEPKLDALLTQHLATALDEPFYWNRLLCQEALDAPAGVSPCLDRAAEAVVRRFEAVTAFSNGPFNSLAFSLWRRTGRPFFRTLFETLARAPLRESKWSAEGAWMHPQGKRGAGWALLVDSFQEDAARLMRLAWLWRLESGPNREAGELEFAALRQFEIHRKILRDSITGLWRNGRGWNPRRANELSPGAWSRGHGWLLRGLTACLEYSSDPKIRSRLADLIHETAEALWRVRDARGLWHALLHRPPEQSPAESSGSAMIAAGLLAGVRLRALPARPYAAGARRAARVLFSEFVTSDGRVRGVCPGPGPLTDETPCLIPEFPAGNPHGAFALTGLAGELLRRRGRR